MTESLAIRLPKSPDVYLQKLDLARDAALLVVLNETAYRNASFLDDRVLAPRIDGAWNSLGTVMSMSESNFAMKV